MMTRSPVSELPPATLDALADVLGRVVAAGPDAAREAERQLQAVHRERHHAAPCSVRVFGSSGSDGEDS